jgi:hypothetical protein
MGQRDVINSNGTERRYKFQWRELDKFERDRENVPATRHGEVVFERTSTSAGQSHGSLVCGTLPFAPSSRQHTIMTSQHDDVTSSKANAKRLTMLTCSRSSPLVTSHHRRPMRSGWSWSNGRGMQAHTRGASLLLCATGQTWLKASAAMRKAIGSLSRATTCRSQPDFLRKAL